MKTESDESDGPCPFGDLCDAKTGEFIRLATAGELAASREFGVIAVEDRSCVVFEPGS